MRSWIAVMLLVLSMVLAACQPVTVEQATANYCQSLMNFNTARLALKGLDENSTVDEAQAAFAAVRVAYQSLQQSAYIVAEAEMAALEQAYDELLNVSRSIEGSMTVGEAQATVQSTADAIDAAWEQLYADADCVNVLDAQP